MRIIIVILVLSQFLAIPAYAETDPHLESKGYTLIQDSWVFSPEKAKQTRDKLIDGETTAKQNESYKISLDLEHQNQDILKQQNKLISDQNESLARNLQAERTVSGWEKFGYFALGIVATVLAGFAIKKAGE